MPGSIRSWPRRANSLISCSRDAGSGMVGMTVSDLHMVYLRAQVAGEEAVMRRVLSEITEPRGMDGLLPLAYQAFVLTVRKKFGPRFTHAEVIRFVAHVRAILSERPELVDPVAAESEILRALGQDVPASPDATARSAAHLAVLDVLVHDMDLEDEAVTGLLNQARRRAQGQAEHT
jgi:hypothetical protein